MKAENVKSLVFLLVFAAAIFLVFLLLILIILPLIKHYLMNYLETALNSENLFFYLIVLFAGMYIYYVLVHRRRHS